MTYTIRETDGFSYAWHIHALPVDTLPWKHVPGATLIGDAVQIGLSNEEGINCTMYDALQLAEEITAASFENLDRAV